MRWEGLGAFGLKLRPVAGIWSLCHEELSTAQGDQ